MPQLFRDWFERCAITITTLDDNASAQLGLVQVGLKILNQAFIPHVQPSYFLLRTRVDHLGGDGCSLRSGDVHLISPTSLSGLLHETPDHNAHN